MNNTRTLIIEDLSHLKGKPANHVSHFLKECCFEEDGTMVDGLINIVDMLNADKMCSVRNAMAGGISIGVLGTVGAYLIHKHYEKCKSRKKIQEVAEILKQEVALAEKKKLPVDENEVIEEV